MLLGFVASGLVGGGPAVLYYPAEPCIYFNAPGVLLGDELYSWAVNTIGDPSSPNASERVPVILRLPWVYVTASPALWTAVGIPFTAAAKRVLSTLAACTTTE